MSTLQKSVRSLLIFATAAVICSVGSAQEPSEQPTGSKAEAGRSQGTTSDQSFVKEAAEGGLAEVELGQLATEKASNPEVKRFAQRMVNDHGKANDQLKQIAAQKSIDLPTKPSAKHRATKDRLSKLTGDKFDKAYMSNMLSDHKEDVAAFRRESTNGQDADVKEFATETLPTLEDHLKEAQTITPKLQRSADNASRPDAPTT